MQNNDGFFRCAIERDALQGYEGRKVEFGTNDGVWGTNDVDFGTNGVREC